MHYISVLAIDLPSQSTIVLMAGCFLLIVGILGGGMEVKEIKIPAIGGVPRCIAGVAGVILLGLSLGIMESNSSSAAPPKPGQALASDPVPDSQAQQSGSAGYVAHGSGNASTGGQPVFMTRELTNADLAGKDYPAINEMKNEIYARHGRRFQDSNIQAYFSAQSWYKPVYSPQDFPASLLTEVQQKNIVFLSQAEQGVTK